MDYSVSDIAKILGAKQAYLPSPDSHISQLLNDSRDLSTPSDTLFFAISSARGDGHRFIPRLYVDGVRAFVVEEFPAGYQDLFPQANFIKVGDSTDAIRHLASYHRSRFNIPVIAITGSRGKTTVKEWLYAMLRDDEEIVRSPRSFNSQIGVPLSLWQIDSSHSLGIFEAGISRKGEMIHHSEMIAPSTVLITNVGAEHADGFMSLEEKAQEKALLASTAEMVVYDLDNKIIDEAVKKSAPGTRQFTYSRQNGDADLFIRAQVNLGDATEIEYLWNGHIYTLRVPFTASADVDNILIILATMLMMGKSPEVIEKRVGLLHTVDTRLEVEEGVNNCMLVIDGYASDFHSLAPALDFMRRRRTSDRTLTAILAEPIDDGENRNRLYREISALLATKQVSRLIAVGEHASQFGKYFQGDVRTFTSVSEMLECLSTGDFDHELILIKGSDEYDFSPVIERLAARQHQTVLEVNLDAMIDNYNFFKSFLRPQTGIVAMLKASGYGAGSLELAKTLQSAGAAYIAVAAHDEGVELRKACITMPIMVLNPKVVNYPSLFANNLEPEIYSFEVLREIIAEGEKCGITDFPVHIKIDSGMHRLGFLKEDLNELTSILMGQDAITPRSVFSHLCAADDTSDDEYTHLQLQYFTECCDILQQAYPDKHILRHILNSTGIVRFPQYQFDMVRLGIGLYGIRTLDDGSMDSLRPISSLHSVVISIKDWPAGTTIGYNRRGLLTRPSKIATLPIGYADGFNRHLGNGHTDVLIRGHRCPIVGNICMDLCMVDVTDCPDCRIGDRAEIFGENITVYELAKTLDTIPYEVLTSVSSRVKRIYYRE